MENNVLARPYAKAIFEIALEHSQLTQWSKLLKFLAGVSTNSHVKSFLLDPRISYQQRSELFVGLCGKKLLEDGNNFLKVLALNRRLINLPEIYQLYEELRTQYEKSIKIEVISAQELTEERQQRLEQVLAEKFESSVEMSYEIDNSLIGGLLVRAGDYVIDGSVRGLLMNLQKQLLR